MSENVIKYVKKKEVVHQWKGSAVVKTKDGQLKEIELGVKKSDKRLTEVGAKELFEKPEGLIALNATKLDDIVKVYRLPLDKFKELAEVVEE